MTQAKYTVIHNPQAWLNKHEVWYAGMGDVQSPTGYLERKHVVKKVRAFRTEEQATGFIKYQESVRAFQEVNTSHQ